MAYIDDVLALNPTAHYKLDEAAGIVATDATGNGNDADIVGTHKLRVASLVRNSIFEDDDTAIDLANGLGGSGTGRLVPPMFSMQGVSFTWAAWIRIRGIGATIFYYEYVLPVTGSVEAWNDGTGGIRVHPLPAVPIRVDSRHFVIFRYNLATDTISMWIDGVNVGSDILPGTVGPPVMFNIGMRQTDQRLWRHYMQHVSIWQGIAISNANIVSLWEAGRERPGRLDSGVDFSEPEYAVGVVPDVTLWRRIFERVTNTATVQDVVDATAGRVLRIVAPNESPAGYSVVWMEAHREPRQRVLTRFRVTAGANLEFSVLLLGGWDWVTTSLFGGNQSSYIEVGVSNNNLIIRHRLFNVTTTLATIPFPYTIADWVNIRAEVDAVTLEIRAKSWLNDDIEPVGWDYNDATMPNEFLWGDGFIGFRANTINTTVDLDLINVAYNSGPPPPDQPSLVAIVDEDGDTELTGSAYVGVSPFLESRLVIRRVFDQSIVEEIIGPFTVWNFPFSTLPFDTILEAQIIYVDNNQQESLPSEWVSFLIEDPTAPPITACDVTIPSFVSEGGGISGECGGIPIEFEDCS